VLQKITFSHRYLHGNEKLKGWHEVMLQERRYRRQDIDVSRHAKLFNDVWLDRHDMQPIGYYGRDVFRSQKRCTRRTFILQYNNAKNSLENLLKNHTLNDLFNRNFVSLHIFGVMYTVPFDPRDFSLGQEVKEERIHPIHH
jgi:hypothetical protein